MPRCYPSEFVCNSQLIIALGQLFVERLGYDAFDVYSAARAN